MSDPIVTILLTTYVRDTAFKTIESLKKNLGWGNLMWWISDDGSPSDHVQQLKDAIGPTYRIETYNSDRKGVGHGMNYSLRKIYEICDLCLVMEDDWELEKPLDLSPYVRLLTNTDNYGLVRFGYLSANLLGYLVSEEGKLLWRLEPNGETYRFTGHPSLRHKRFHQHYGWYDEGLPAGWTELSMAGKVNQFPKGPHIVYPTDCGTWGFFGHIGSESLRDIQPEK